MTTDEAGAGPGDAPVRGLEIAPLIGDLKGVARRLLARERNAQSVQPTDLVHMALRRMIPEHRGFAEVTWENRRVFFACAFRSMRQILSNRGRDRNRRKKNVVYAHELHPESMSFEPVSVGEEEPLAEPLARALEQLESRHPRWAEAFQHRYFVELSLGEIAAMMDVSVRTVSKWLRSARAFLQFNIRRDIGDGQGNSDDRPD